MTEPRGIRKIFDLRAFWVVLAIVLLVLAGLSWTRGETEFVVIYGLLLAVAVARATGWRMKPM